MPDLNLNRGNTQGTEARQEKTLVQAGQAGESRVPQGSALGSLLSGLTPFFRDASQVQTPQQARAGGEDAKAVRSQMADVAVRTHTTTLARVANYKGLGTMEARETGFKVAQGLLLETARTSGPGASMGKARDLVRGYPGSPFALSLAMAQDAVDRADPADQETLAYAVDALEAGGIPVPYAMLEKRGELTATERKALVPLDRNQVSSFLAGVRHALVQAEAPSGNRVLMEEGRRRTEAAESATQAFRGQRATQEDFLASMRELAMETERGLPAVTPHTLREAADHSGLEVGTYVETALGALEARMDALHAGTALGLDPKMAEALAKTAATVGVQSSVIVNQAKFADVTQPRGQADRKLNAVDWAKAHQLPLVRAYIDQASRAVGWGTAANPEVRQELKERFERIEHEHPALARVFGERGMDPDSLAKTTREQGLTSARQQAALTKGRELAQKVPEALGFAHVADAGVENAGLVAVPSRDGSPNRLVQLSVLGSEDARAHEVRVLESAPEGAKEVFRGPAAEIPDLRTRDIAITAATYYRDFSMTLDFGESRAIKPLAVGGPKAAGLTPTTSGSLLRLLGATPLGEVNARGVDPRVVVA